MRLAQLQRAFAAKVLQGDDRIMAFIQDSRREDKHVLMGVYEHAYGARLAEILEGDYEKLFAALGRDAFLQMAAEYATAHPSAHPNARFFGANLPKFLTENAPWSDRPWLAELAALEWSMGVVFLAEDALKLSMEAMAILHPQDWPTLRFQCAKDIVLLESNAGGPEAWLALDANEAPIEAAAAAPTSTQDWIVWRDAYQANFRAMEPGEAWAFRQAGNGANFAEICEGLMEIVPADEAAGYAAGCLKGWIEAGILAGFTIGDD